MLVFSGVGPLRNKQALVWSCCEVCLKKYFFAGANFGDLLYKGMYVFYRSYLVTEQDAVSDDF